MNLKNVTVLTSSDEKGLSEELPEWQHGVDDYGRVLLRPHLRHKVSYLVDAERAADAGRVGEHGIAALSEARP